MATLNPVAAYTSSFFEDVNAGGHRGHTHSLIDGSSTTRWVTDQGVGEWCVLDFGGEVTINQVDIDWEAAFASGYKLQISSDGTSWTDIFTTTTNSPTFTSNHGPDSVTGLSATGRFLRLLSTALDVDPYMSIWSIVCDGTAGTSWRLTRTGSSGVNVTEGGSANARDGSLTTRWGSSNGLSSSLYMDLGSAQPITGVAIAWEIAEATTYTIRTSNDASSWTNQRTGVLAQAVPPQDLSVTARYIQLIPESLYVSGYMSIWEFNVISQPAAGGGSPPPSMGSGQRQLRTNASYRMSPQNEARAQKFLRERRAYSFAAP